VNVANGFRRSQKLPVVKSKKWSEMSRPNFNERFRASLSTCLSISMLIASTPIFGEFSKSAENPSSETNSETSNCYISEMLRWISSFLRQSLVLVSRYRNVEFDLPASNTKNGKVGGIMKFGVTFGSNFDFYGEKLATR
jgi:hypothetical protein